MNVFTLLFVLCRLYEATAATSSVLSLNRAFPWKQFRAGSSKTDGRDVTKTGDYDRDLRHLEYIKSLTSKSDKELEDDGWSAVVPTSSANSYRVFQRPDSHNSSQSQFLVIALLSEVSPRAALFANVNNHQRKRWDAGLKDIYSLPANVNMTMKGHLQSQIHSTEHTFETSCRDGFDEVLYYRSKCPWPMKDRDYVMSKRCRIFEDKGAALIVSEAVEDSRVGPTPAGVNRITSYKSIAGFLSCSNTVSNDKQLLDMPGTYYVSLSSEEQITASPSVMRVLNKVAGKMISDYMMKMTKVITDIQDSLTA